MDMSELIERTKQNIWQAISDYGKHTDQTSVMDDCTANFVNQLASDSCYAKQELRELFSKSPVWDANLDALVINGTRTHDPDPDRIYEQSAVKPWLLFTCDEEVGGVGASVFCTRFQKGKLPKKELESLKMLVEIDRKGRNDAVYYDCDNPEFEEYITSKGFETDFGSFSDISLIAPALGVAAVNLSSGYYNAHTQHEYIDRKHLNATVKKVVEIVADAAKPDFPQYEYIESYRFSRYGYGGWGDWGRGTYPLVLEDAPNLKKVPADIRNEYAALLDFYTEGELEALRKEHGDNVIRMLFESEMADYYGDMYDEEELK